MNEETFAPTPAPSQPDGNAVPGPRCLYMRTKMDYVTRDEDRPSGRPAEWDEDITRGGTAHHLYCLQTLTVIGPDDDVVGPRVCTSERCCYESSGF